MNLTPKNLLNSIFLILIIVCFSNNENVVNAATENGPLTNEIYTIDGGGYQVTRGCSEVCVGTHHFWIDLAVKDLTYTKEVYVEWTEDNWQTKGIAYAFYQSELDSHAGYEKWKIDFQYGNWGPSDPGTPAAQIKFRAFAKMSGKTFEDQILNEGSLVSKVYPGTPVSLDNFQAKKGAVHVDETGQARLSQKIEVFEYPGLDSKVDVLYSTDRWETKHWVSASKLTNTTYQFQITNLGSAELPEELEYTVRYTVAGREFWDHPFSNQNFKVKLEPRLRFDRYGSIWNQQNPPEFSSDQTQNFRLVTDLELDSTRYRLDNGSWQPCSAEFIIPVMDLDDGTHELTIEASFEGSKLFRTYVYPFVVNNSIASPDFYTQI